MNPLSGRDDLPPGCSLNDLDPPERRRDRDEDDDFWRDYWLYASERREREESQRGNDGEPHE
jgi:hypothetical protein